MGESINLVENFKVEKVIFNCGEFNELELALIKVLDKKKISYYSCIKELSIDDSKLYFLNSGDYGDEKRFYQRDLTRKGNYSLNIVARNAGVENFDRFHNSGYRGYIMEKLQMILLK